MTLADGLAGAWTHASKINRIDQESGLIARSAFAHQISDVDLKIFLVASLLFDYSVIA